MSKKRVRLGLFSSTWHNIRRSPFQSLSAILIMWLNFLLATSLVFLVLIFNSLLGYFETRPEVTAFLKDGVSQKKINQLGDKIKSTEGTKEVRFVSKEEALKIYREQNKDNPLLLEMVTSSILPASLEVSATSPEYLSKIAETLKSETGLVEEVIFREDVVKNLSFWAKAIRNGGLILVGLLTFVSLVVIMTIVGMKVSAHREEISVLKSLGATPFYISAPFLLEGVFYGFLGVVLGFGLIFGAYFYWQDVIQNFFDPIKVLLSQDQLVIILAGELAAGILLGLIAANSAARRFFKK